MDTQTTALPGSHHAIAARARPPSRPFRNVDVLVGEAFDFPELQHFSERSRQTLDRLPNIFDCQPADEQRLRVEGWGPERSAASEVPRRTLYGLTLLVLPRRRAPPRAALPGGAGLYRSMRAS